MKFFIRKIASILFILVFLYGCVSNSELTQIGTNTFVISQKVKSSENIKTEEAYALIKANQYCNSRSYKDTKLINISKPSLPYNWNNFQKLKIEFMCIERNGNYLVNLKDKSLITKK